MNKDDKEKVKGILISEIEAQFSKQENKLRKTTGLDKFNAWSEKFEKFPQFSEIVIDKLNEIIEREGYEFSDDNEKDEFIDYIRPTIKELMQKFLRN